jgi:hypothetical protein
MYLPVVIANDLFQISAWLAIALIVQLQALELT